MPNLHQKLDIKVIYFVQHIYCMIISRESRESQFTKSLEVSKNMLNRGPLFANLQKLPNFGCIDETIILLHKFCNWFSDVDRAAGDGAAVKWRAASSLSQFWLMWAGWHLHHLHHGHGQLVTSVDYQEHLVLTYLREWLFQCSATFFGSTTLWTTTCLHHLYLV